MQITANLSVAARDEEFTNKSRPERQTWDKQYHEPNEGWSNSLRRSRGGWWVCRSDPEATQAERECPLCHQPSPDSTAAQTVSIAEKYQLILAEIEAAQAKESAQDGLALRFQQQHGREQCHFDDNFGNQTAQNRQEINFPNYHYRPAPTKPPQSLQPKFPMKRLLSRCSLPSIPRAQIAEPVVTRFEALATESSYPQSSTANHLVMGLLVLQRDCGGGIPRPRSSMSRPGRKGSKGKRVSWEI